MSSNHSLGVSVTKAYSGTFCQPYLTMFAFFHKRNTFFSQWQVWSRVKAVRATDIRAKNKALFSKPQLASASGGSFSEWHYEMWSHRHQKNATPVAHLTNQPTNQQTNEPTNWQPTNKPSDQQTNEPTNEQIKKQTNFWCQCTFEKLTVPQLFKKFPPF